MIEISQVSHRFDEKAVIRDLSFTFPEKGIFALMGPSGCGKTTLLRLIAGLEKPSSGSITHNGTKIAMAFQEPRLLPWLNCRSNINIVLSKSKRSSNEAEAWFEAFELKDAADLMPNELSGGMQQRVSLARALAAGADLILLDEPLTGLDEELKLRLAPMIKKACEKATVILVTHDASEAESLSATVLQCVGSPLCDLTRA